MESLDRMEREVDQWRPTPPADFLEHYSQTESMHSLAQAHVFSLTVLLMIHRFRFQYGVNDENAFIVSKCVMRELDSTRIVMRQVVKFAALSLIVAVVEITNQDEHEKAIGGVSQMLRHSRRFHERLMCLILLL